MSKASASAALEVPGADRKLYNHDLAPTASPGRTWGVFSLFAMWMSDVHSVGGYTFAASLFFLGLSARLFRSTLTRLRGSTLFLLAAPVGFLDRSTPPRLLVRFTKILYRARAPGLFLGGERPREHDRTTRRLHGFQSRRRRLARHGGRCLWAARFSRSGSKRALLADLDGHGLGSPVRETLPHLRRLDRLAQFELTAAASEG